RVDQSEYSAPAPSPGPAARRVTPAVSRSPSDPGHRTWPLSPDRLPPSQYAQQGLPLFDRLIRLDTNPRHGAVTGRLELILHPPGFQDEQDLSFFRRLPLLDQNGNDQTGHRGTQQELAGLCHAAACRAAKTFFALIFHQNWIETPAQ